MKKLTKFKKRIAILFLSVLTALFALFGVASCGTSQEGGDTAGRFSLDKTSITLKSKGSSELLETESESEKITILYDGKNYNGAVSWTVDSDSIAAVYQGYVTALRAGETNVNAYVEENNKTYKVSCKVTVISGVVAQTDRISVYSGSGDIDLTIGSGLMTTGASYSVKDVLDSNGTSVKAQYLSSNGNALKNSAATPMTAGHYEVVYTLTKGDVTDEAVRDINVKRADSYSDFLLVDPIDGTENISGSALLYPWTSVNDNPSPGEYVVASDEKDAITGETKTEFLQSLSNSGYDGYLNENTPGYDTVYRMYVYKANKASAPYPNFFVNLIDTESALWGNLSKLPQGTQLSMWVRLTVKAKGSDIYEHRRATHAYPYKVQNSGFTNYDGVNGSFNADGGWTNFRISVSEFATKLNDARNFGVCFGTGVGSFQGDVWLDIYSVELTSLSTAFAPTGKYDLALSGSYTGIFDGYTFRVLNGENQEIATGNESSTLVEDLPKGKYTVEYTLKRGDTELPNKTVRNLYSGVLNDLLSATSISQSSWGTNNSLALDKTLAKGKPQASIVDKTTCVYRNVIDTEGRDMPSFDISSVLSEIDTLDDRDYIGLWAYFEKGEVTSRPVRVYLSESNGDWGSNSTGTVIFDNTASWSGTLVASTISFDEWTLVKVTVGELKEVLAKRTDLKNINRICFQFNNMANRGYKEDYQNYRYYYYALEYYAFDPSSFEMTKSNRSLMVGEKTTIELDGFFADDVQTWTWASGNTAVATVDQDGNVQAKGVGTADITFTALEKTVTCTLTVTKERRFDSTEFIRFKNDNMNVSVVDAVEEGIGLPQGTTGNAVVKATFRNQTSGGTAFPTFDIRVAIDQLATLKNSHYISVRMYTPTPKAFWTSAKQVLLTNKADGTGATKGIESVTHTFEDTVNGGWVEITIPAASIKAAYESGYDYLQFDCWRGADVVSKPFYFHSWEIKQKDMNGRFDTTSSMSFKNDNMNKSVVSATEEGIGLPQGVTGDQVLKATFKVQTGGNTTFPTFDISVVIDRLDELKDTDYISLKMYTGTKAFWSGKDFDFLTNRADGSGATKGIEGATHTFENTANGGWVEVKLPVSGIKAAYQEGYNYIQLNCWRGADVVSKPFYFHSWTLVQPNA